MKKLYTFSFFLLLSSSSTFAQLVYKDVAGIFYNRCTQCHHVGGGGPMSMMNYSETVPWAPFIQANLQSGKMPPWPPDTTYTRLLHERIITVSEKNDILSWIAGGSQMGDTTIANGCPPAPVYAKYQLNGTPDLVLKVPGFASNASGSDAYNCFALPTGLTQDRILRAFEIVPNNGPLVHHVVVTVDTMGTATTDVSGGCFNQPGDFGMGGYAPGSPPSVFPSAPQLRLGMRIKAGSKIVMQQHYPAGSAGQIDSTEIRLYFYPTSVTGIRPVYSNTFLQNWTMAILPNTTATYTAKYPTGNNPPLSVPISIFATSPHAHKINRSMTVYAFRASPVDTIPLIRIPVWDFEWQGMYVHPNMVKIPAGYKLGSKHFYDNTTNNPDNPNNPPQFVQAGTATTDEMLFDSFEWTPYQTGDELIDIGDILANDSLLNPNGTTSVSDISSSHVSSYAYPNPFSEYVQIGYEILKPTTVSVSVFDILGNEVRNISRQFNSAGRYSVIWDGKNNAGEKVPAGVYFYSVRAGKAESGGKIVLTSK